MMFNDKQLMKLAELVQKYIKEDFEAVHLSGNLMETIKINRTATSIEIEVPAERYDIKRFNKEGVIVYTGNGSYAQAVDIWGGFSKTHKNYIEDAIKQAVQEWLISENIRAREVSVI